MPIVAHDFEDGISFNLRREGLQSHCDDLQALGDEHQARIDVVNKEMDEFSFSKDYGKMVEDFWKNSEEPGSGAAGTNASGDDSSHSLVCRDSSVAHSSPSDVDVTRHQNTDSNNDSETYVVPGEAKESTCMDGKGIKRNASDRSDVSDDSVQHLARRAPPASSDVQELPVLDVLIQDASVETSHKEEVGHTGEFTRRMFTFHLLDPEYFAVEESPAIENPSESPVNQLADEALLQTFSDQMSWINEQQHSYHIVKLAFHNVLVQFLKQNIAGASIIPSSDVKLIIAGRARNFKYSPCPSVSDIMERLQIPSKVAHALHNFQRKTLVFVVNNNGKAYIADDMGLGKSIQALAAMGMYRNQWPLLIICPKSAHSIWLREIQTWLDGSARVKQLDGTVNDLASFDIGICSIDSVSNYVMGQSLYCGQFKCIIVDEAHMMKNEESARTKAISPLLCSADRVLLLSGTPSTATPEELWPQLAALNDWWVSKDDFMAEYVYCSGPTALRNHMILSTLLHGTVMVQRMKQDVLTLPPKVRYLYMVEPDSHIFENHIKPVMAQVRDGKGVLASILKCHDSENATDDVIVDSSTVTNVNPQVKNAVMACWKYTGLSKVPTVVSALTLWLPEHNGQKVCIFAHHSVVLDGIRNGAKLLSENSIRIDSSVDAGTCGRLVQ